MWMWIVLSLAVALVAINGVAFWMFYWDKWCAENNRQRIPEANLLGVALIGGSIGAIWAQQKFRHKTRKEPFRSLLFGIAALQFLFVGVMCIAPRGKAALDMLTGAYRAACVQRFEANARCGGWLGGFDKE